MHSKTYYAVRTASRAIVRLALVVGALWAMQLMIVLTWAVFGG